jgi:hypothetical protein
MEPFEEFADWERFQSLDSNFMSPRIGINSVTEADKVAREFTASIASSCKLSTSKNIVPEFSKNLPGLDGSAKHTKRRRQLWNKASKTAFNRILKTIKYK